VVAPHARGLAETTLGCVARRPVLMPRDPESPRTIQRIQRMEERARGVILTLGVASGSTLACVTEVHQMLPPDASSSPLSGALPTTTALPCGVA